MMHDSPVCRVDGTVSVHHESKAVVVGCCRIQKKTVLNQSVVVIDGYQVFPALIGQEILSPAPHVIVDVFLRPANSHHSQRLIAAHGKVLLKLLDSADIPCGESHSARGDATLRTDQSCWARVCHRLGIRRAIETW